MFLFHKLPPLSVFIRRRPFCIPQRRLFSFWLQIPVIRATLPYPAHQDVRISLFRPLNFRNIRVTLNNCCFEVRFCFFEVNVPLQIIIKRILD